MKAGIIVKADTLDELAAETGLTVDALKATVELFNGFARSGVGEDFHRGEGAYRHYGDPTNKPHPTSVRPGMRPPFRYRCCPDR